MKKVLIISLITISVFMLTGCGKAENSNGIKGSNQIKTCPNCVFAYYREYKRYGENGDILTEYTNDYTTLKDQFGNQINKFLGHILDENGKILRGFACGIYNDKVFCLEGTNDGSKFESNVEIIKSIFVKENCSKEITERFQCIGHGDQGISPYANREGAVGMNSASCHVDRNFMDCYD